MGPQPSSNPDVRRILLVDHTFTATNPTWSSLVRCLPLLRAGGYEFTVWCWTCEPRLDVQPVLLPRPPLPKVFWPFAFSLTAHLYWLFQAAKGGLRNFSASFSNGFSCTFCELCYVHFSHFDYAATQLRMPVRTWRDVAEVVREWTDGLGSELVLFWSPTRNTLLAVSDAVVRDIRRFAAPWKRVKLLPNSYDPTRWNERNRLAYREAKRRELGIAESTTVFAFISQGHFRRKGFWLAAEAIDRLSRREHCLLLVIGGHPPTLRRLQRELSRALPGWERYMKFAGMVMDALPSLAACDALLFPSYSEAFSLVEIEAATLGLRLYLTPHHGSEMILEEGRNGRFLPWDAAGIAAILEEDLRHGKLRPGPSFAGRALDTQKFKNALCTILDSPNATKTATS